LKGELSLRASFRRGHGRVFFLGKAPGGDLLQLPRYARRRNNNKTSRQTKPPIFRSGVCLYDKAPGGDLLRVALAAQQQQKLNPRSFDRGF